MAGWIIGGIAVILLILIVRGLFKKAVPAWVTYALWLVVLARLLCPFNFGRLPVSVLNLFPQYGNYDAVGEWQDGAEYAERNKDTVNAASTAWMADAAVSADGKGNGAADTVPTADGIGNNDAETDWKQMSDAYVGNAAEYDTNMQTGDGMPTDTSDVAASQEGNGALSFSMADGGTGTVGVYGVRLTTVCRIVWVAGMAVMALVLLAFNMVFFMRLRRSRKAVDMEVCGILRGYGVQERANRQRMRHNPSVYVVKWLATPCLFGLFKPSIYLNEDALQDDRVDYCIAHEYSHYLQKDYIWSFLRSVCLVLHWYNPLVWLAVYLSKQDGELACDERTLARLGGENRYLYGHVLIEMSSDGVEADGQKIKHGQKMALLLFGTATMMNFGKKEMRQRIKAIASGRKTKKIAVFMAALMTFLAVPAVFTDAKAKESEIADRAGYVVTERDAEGLAGYVGTESDAEGLAGYVGTESDAEGLAGYVGTESDAEDLVGYAGTESDAADFVDYEETGQLVLMLPKGTTVAADFCKKDGTKRKLRVECDADSGIEKEGYNKIIFGKSVGRDTLWQRMTQIYYVTDIDAADGYIEGAAYGRLGYPVDEYLYLTFFHFVAGEENCIKMVGKLPLPKEGNYTHMVISADDLSNADTPISQRAEVAIATRNLSEIWQSEAAVAAGNVSGIWQSEAVNVAGNLLETRETDMDMTCRLLTVINGDGTVYSPYCLPILDGLWVQGMWRMRGENLVFEQQSEYVPYRLSGNKNEYDVHITKDIMLCSSPDNVGEVTAQVYFKEGEKARIIGVSQAEWQPYRRYNASQLDSFWLGLEREDGTVGWLYCDDAQTCGDYIQ